MILHCDSDGVFFLSSMFISFFYRGNKKEKLDLLPQQSQIGAIVG